MSSIRFISSILSVVAIMSVSFWGAHILLKKCSTDQQLRKYTQSIPAPKPLQAAHIPITVEKKNVDENQNQIEEKPVVINAPTVLKRDPLYWNWKTIDCSQLSFPKDFLWGVSTSAVQIEGNCQNSDWADWERKHRDVKAIGVACNHWNTFKDDIALIKKSGFNTYRFSVDWSKIEPIEGQFDEAALMHYEEVCKELLKNNITPIITLHHYINPAWFAKRGGFEKLQNSSYFVRFCTTVFKRLQPYANRWVTFNSPTSYVARAYYKELMPPAKSNTQLMQEVLKNMLETHVQVYQALKSLPGGMKAHIGISHNIYQVEAATLWDQAACHSARSILNKNVYNFFKTGHFKASIPFQVNVSHTNTCAPATLDFIALNYYSHGQMSNFNVKSYPGDLPTQAPVYSIYPEGLFCAIEEIYTEIAGPLEIPIYITENGIATDNEEHRELFFKRYLFALSYAIQQGYPVKGYCVWSLMDNYEWGSFDTHYGIYSVDFTTFARGQNPRIGAQYLLDTVKKFSTKI